MPRRAFLCLPRHPGRYRARQCRTRNRGAAAGRKQPLRDRVRRRRRQPPRDQPARLRRLLRHVRPSCPSCAAPLVRMGGNNTSRYNWQQNADNRARDWYFESIPADSGSATAGELGDTFVGNAKSGGAQPMLTFPMIRWVAKVGREPQQARELLDRQVRRAGRRRLVLVPRRRQRRAHERQRRHRQRPERRQRPEQPVRSSSSGRSTSCSAGARPNAGGLRYYILDNEHSIWHETHRDVQPTGAKMDEVRDLMIAYAAALKAVDPGAQIVGPEEWGWSGFKFSGYDQQYGKRNGWSNLPDQPAHGGVWYMPVPARPAAPGVRPQRGVRLLDVFTLHCYPQSGEFSNDVSQQMQLTRNRSTRSLWDPNYVDQTWINDTVRLVPRMKEWVNAVLPGHEDRHHRVQLGRRGPHQRRDDAGRHPRHLRPRGPRHGRALGDPRPGDADLQGDEDVPQLRQRRRRVRRHQREGGRCRTRTSCRAFAAQRSSDGALTVLVVNKVLSGSTPVRSRSATSRRRATPPCGS